MTLDGIPFRSSDLFATTLFAQFLGSAWLFMTINITLKEVSMLRYPEWEQYKKHSWRLLPPIL